MYQNLLFSMKKRILDESIDAFNNHPAYSAKVKVYNKFPYEKRIQFGVLLKNASASTIRLSADNYMAELYSHVRMAKSGNFPGLGIEWVRENSLEITTEVTEDVSDQVDPTQRRFFTQNQITAGRGLTTLADNVGQVQVTVNGESVTPEYVNGTQKIVLLRYCPLQGATVLVRYYKKNLAPPGVYVIDFPSANQFVVCPIYIIMEEMVIDNTLGTENTASLDNSGIYPGSEELYLKSSHGGDPYLFVRDTDYSIDNATGLITFLKPLPKGLELLADYRYQTGDSYGPYNFRAYQENHEAIPGVVLCLGRRSQKDDRQVVLVSDKRSEQALIYGGHWTMSLSMNVIAKDPVQMEEMTDHMVNYLWAERKNILEFEGITLNRVEPTGETEETFVDTTGDLYYEQALDIEVMTEWQYFVPFLWEIKHIYVNNTLMRYEDVAKNFKVSLSNDMVFRPLKPDMRKVAKYGVTGYERVI